MIYDFSLKHMFILRANSFISSNFQEHAIQAICENVIKLGGQVLGENKPNEKRFV